VTPSNYLLALNAVIGAGIGGLPLYRTWAMAIFAIMMFGLIVRARREEQTLAAEYLLNFSGNRSLWPVSDRARAAASPHKPHDAVALPPMRKIFR